jgi:hypothetical protein
MDKGFTVVIGLTVAYIFSLLGAGLAYISYRRRKKEGDRHHE